MCAPTGFVHRRRIVLIFAGETRPYGCREQPLYRSVNFLRRLRGWGRAGACSRRLFVRIMRSLGRMRASAPTGLCTTVGLRENPTEPAGENVAPTFGALSLGLRKIARLLGRFVNRPYDLSSPSDCVNFCGRTQFAPTGFAHHCWVCVKSDRDRAIRESPLRSVHHR